VPPQKTNRPCLFCLTTSRFKHRPLQEGCQSERSEFLILKDKEFFAKDTWLQLHSIYEVEKDSFLQDCLRKNIQLKHTLSNLTIRQIINCIKISKDVEQRYMDWILTQELPRA
jgi:hypothetical protein